MPVATRSDTRHPLPLSNRRLTIALVQWKVLVVDENSRKLINAALKEEEILNLNVSSELYLPRIQDGILRSIVSLQMSNRSNIDGCPTRIWTRFTYCHRSHGSSTALWRTSRRRDTGRHTWFGRHVSWRQRLDLPEVLLADSTHSP